jgi:DNA-binding transcriptional LysR family regulator
MDRLHAIETFLKAIDLGSFNRTASAQGTTPQAVSKAVRQLERELGVQLFRRSTRKSSLTEEGRRFADKVRPGIDTINSAWQDALRAVTEEQGTIRLTASPSLGRLFLLPLIGAFRQVYPGVMVELLSDDRYTDLIDSDIDIGFRSGFPPDAQLVVRELFRIQMIICASPKYLAEHGAPLRREDLDGHQLTGARHPNTGRISPWEFQQAGELRFGDLPAGFTSNDTEAETHAVVAGLGVGQLDSISASHHLRSGALVPLMLDQVNERYGVYMYYAQRTEIPSRVRKFIDFVMANTGDAAACRLTETELKNLHRRGLRNVAANKPGNRPTRAQSS